jgi:hypothetical protein
MHNLKKKETQRDGSLEYSKAWSLIDSPQKVPGLGCSRKLWPVALFVAHLLFRKGKVSAVQYLLGVPSPRRIVSELSSSNQEEKEI